MAKRPISIKDNMKMITTTTETHMLVLCSVLSSSPASWTVACLTYYIAAIYFWIVKQWNENGNMAKWPLSHRSYGWTLARLTRFRMQTGAPPLTSEHKAFLFEKWRLLEYPYSSTKGVWLFERCLVAGGQLHDICVCMCVRVQQQTEHSQILNLIFQCHLQQTTSAGIRGRSIWDKPVFRDQCRCGQELVKRPSHLYSI